MWTKFDTFPYHNICVSFAKRVGAFSADSFSLLRFFEGYFHA